MANWEKLDKQFYDAMKHFDKWVKIRKKTKAEKMELSDELKQYLRYTLEALRIENEQMTTSPLSIKYAMSAWTKPTTENIIVNEVLAHAFAEVVNEILNQAWLGNATTGELLDEIAARVDLRYKTIHQND